MGRPRCRRRRSPGSPRRWLRRCSSGRIGQDLYKCCYGFGVSEPDALLDSSYYRPLFQLLAGMDRDIAELCTERGHRSVSTRFVGPLVELSRTGPMSVRELAAAREVTHSAMSQTVAAMSRAGLVTTEPGEDARTRMVSLAPAAAELVPLCGRSGVPPKLASKSSTESCRTA